VSRTELLEFMLTQTNAVQASVSPAGAAQTAVINIAVTDSFEIVFDSVDTTRKVKNLLLNLSISGWTLGDKRTAQHDGIADKPEGAEIERLKNIYYGDFPTGRLALSQPGIT